MKPLYLKCFLVILVCLCQIKAVMAQPEECFNLIPKFITSDFTLSFNSELGNVYCLDGITTVFPGATLTIEPGVVIKAVDQERTSDGSVSVLIISRQASIMAEGREFSPIIFTALQDDLSNPFDMGEAPGNLWGGIMILGDAMLNSPEEARNEDGFIEERLEWIPPQLEFDLDYGGAVCDGNSGTMRYVSIRHAGAQVATGDTLAALTMAAVGAKTTIEYIDIYTPTGDGMSYIGGCFGFCAGVKRVIVAFPGDDAFDLDQGANINGQFWFAIGDANAGSDRGAEHDGATSPENAQPYSVPNISNVTYIGPGPGAPNEPEAIIFQDAAGGRYLNSVFCDHGLGTQIEWDFNEIISSNSLLNAGKLFVRNSDFERVGVNFDPFNVFSKNCVGDPKCTNHLKMAQACAKGIFEASESANTIAPACPVVSISRTPDGGLDPRYTGTEPTIFPGPFEDPFFEKVSYRGAFGPSRSEFWGRFSFLCEIGVFAPFLCFDP